MKHPLTPWIAPTILFMGLIGSYAVGQDHIADNKIEIDKLKTKTSALDVIEYKQEVLQDDVTEIKKDLKSLLNLVRRQ